MDFFFCNDHGFSAATVFSKSDSGSSFDWVEVCSKKRRPLSAMAKSSPSFAEVVKRQAPVLSEANATPLGPSGRKFVTHLARNYSHSRFDSVGRAVKNAGPRRSVFSRISSVPNSTCSVLPSSRKSVFQRIKFPPGSVFDRLIWQLKCPHTDIQGSNLNSREKEKSSRGSDSQSPKFKRLNIVASRQATCKRCLSPTTPRLTAKIGSSVGDAISGDMF